MMTLVNVWYDGENDNYWFDRPGGQYQEAQGTIEIPEAELGDYLDAQDLFHERTKRLRDWLHRHIESNGGGHYEEYLAGEITEEQMKARIAGCEHGATTVEESFGRRREICDDCGRYRFRDTWL